MRADTSHSDRNDMESEMLQGVSRSFALTIPQLPHPLRMPVTNGYLLCRIADTIEDEEALTIEQKGLFFRELVEVLEGNKAAPEFACRLFSLLSQSTPEPERELIRNTPVVVRRTFTLKHRQQLALKRCVAIMADGMQRFQETKDLRGLKSLYELDRYCYHVAGVVGEMLTDLFCDYSEEIERRKERLFALAPSFGQGLQMTNILKDFWDDRDRGACWLPHEHSPGPLGRFPKRALAELVAIARSHLENGLNYSLIIPRREKGIRRFCLWAIGLAIFTLRNIVNHPDYSSGGEVKVSRGHVKMIMALTNMTLCSNTLVRGLFGLSSKLLTSDQGWNSMAELCRPGAPEGRESNGKVPCHEQQFRK